MNTKIDLLNVVCEAVELLDEYIAYQDRVSTVDEVRDTMAALATEIFERG